MSRMTCCLCFLPGGKKTGLVDQFAVMNVDKSEVVARFVSV